MTWHNTKEIEWHTIMEIGWHSIQEIEWHKLVEIRHADGAATIFSNELLTFSSHFLRHQIKISDNREQNKKFV